jgi:hypothetical protein
MTPRDLRDATRELLIKHDRWDLYHKHCPDDEKETPGRKLAILRDAGWITGSSIKSAALTPMGVTAMAAHSARDATDRAVSEARAIEDRQQRRQQYAQHKIDNIGIAKSCCVCGRPLTDAMSFARGVGPDCLAGLRKTFPDMDPNDVNALLAAGLGIRSITFDIANSQHLAQ